MNKGNKEVRVSKFQRGSSGATLVIHKNMDDEEVVRKSTNTNFFKLIDQYKWLNEHANLDFMPEVSNPIRQGHGFSYDIKYYKNYKTLSEIALGQDVQKSCKSLTKLFGLMETYFYNVKSRDHNVDNLEIYLKEKVLKKIKQCEGWNEKYNKMFTSEYIYINDSQYMNFPKIWDKISSKRIMTQLSGSKQCEIHGDLTAENILVSKDDKIILLDPNQENFFSSISVDVAKLYQSFHSKYELIRDIKDVTLVGNILNYSPPKSDSYSKVYSFLSNEIESRFKIKHTEIIFHEAIHFTRMLPYKIIESGETFPAYYSIMIKLFNDVLDDL